ncbi:MAG: flagellin FliC [Nitrospinaceae bacterium]|nr:flagellin FliC [Nitrospinaceae bacterium]NIR56635.1 flagellin FliC [Nitrospinaceae bacterium]NIS87098.1 flagellin FliC [Nitrospinaceae bacterium]NIT83952.1 flagellin FliC [Nitrospinaceae bacterium]NIU46143.1 flagellin FliC [Nitrospinaceae bacterium]
MAVRIFNNIPSLNAQRHLGINNLRLAQSIERVSSGLRINKAGDDVAGLAISEKLRSDIRVLQQGLRNLNDGLSMINVIEAALNEDTDMLIRMRELAAQAASATIGDTERALLQVEVDALIAEIDRIAAATEFNGQPLLDGSLTTFIVHFGLDNTANSQIDLVAAGAIPTAAVDSTFLGVAGLDITTAANAQLAVDTVNAAIDTLMPVRAGVAAVQNRMTRIINTQAIVVENIQAAESQIRDADIAAEVALLTRNQILVESATAMVGQANLIPQSVLQLLS